MLDVLVRPRDSPAEMVYAVSMPLDLKTQRRLKLAWVEPIRRLRFRKFNYRAPLPSTSTCTGRGIED
jgi:hypothetical protein